MTIHSLGNFFTGAPHLFWITFVACFTVSLIRRLLIKRWWVAACTHLILLTVLLCLISFHSPVHIYRYNSDCTTQDLYAQLDFFKQLEQTNQLTQAKQNAKQYDDTTYVTLTEFENSQDLQTYIQQLNTHEEKADKLFKGWLVALMCDLIIAIACLLRRLFKRRKIAPS